MSKQIVHCLIFVSLATALQSALLSAEETDTKRLRASDAVLMASKNNPDLRAAVLDKERAKASVEAEEGLYPFMLQLDGSLNRSVLPSISGQDLKASTTKTAAAGAELNKSLPVGTDMSLRVEGNRQTFDSTPNADAYSNKNLDTGPSYGMDARFQVTQPFIRGAGKRVGKASLRQSRISEDISKIRLQRTASEVTRDVLTTYWSLWYADRALDIQVAARNLAKTQLDEMLARQMAGSAAAVEALAFETRLAELEESVVAAEKERRRLGLEIGRLIGGKEIGTMWFPDSNEEPPSPEIRESIQRFIEIALEKSPEILEFRSHVALSKERSSIAGEDMRPGLDLTGYVQADIVGNNDVRLGFEQLKGNAYSAYVGLIYTMPLSTKRKNAQRAEAQRSVDITEQNLMAIEDSIVAAVKTAFDKLVTSQQVLTLVERTTSVAEKQAAAEQEKFNLGASVYLQVKEAEEAARRAKLRLVQAKVDAAMAGIELSHLVGELFDQTAPTNPNR